MISEERIKELALSLGCKPDIFEVAACSHDKNFIFELARAIEAECAKVPEAMLQYVRSYWNPHKGLTATQLAHNNTISDLIEGLEKIMLAPAPQPAPKAEKQEPVKDEPVAYVNHDLRKSINWAEGYAKLPNEMPLYTRPQPDLTAEVERLKLSAEHWNRLYREKCQEFHDAQANKGHEIVWLIDRIAALEEAARQARDAFEQHDGNYKLSKASGAVVEAAIAKLDAVLGNAELKRGSTTPTKASDA